MQHPRPKPGSRGSSDADASLAGDAQVSSKPRVPLQAVTEAWSDYADNVIAFQAARTAAHADALARSYRSFVSLFLESDGDAGVVVHLDLMRPGGAP